MILYHFTSADHLHGISRYGLTVGDVPTDIERGKGRIGIWFSSNPDPGGNGLEGGGTDKTRYRLSVDVDDQSPLFHRWLEWAEKNVTKQSVERLHEIAAKTKGQGPESWFIYLGVVGRERIVSCFDLQSRVEVPDWRDLPIPLSVIAPVPPWRREAWQRQMLKKVSKAVRQRRGG